MDTQRVASRRRVLGGVAGLGAALMTERLTAMAQSGTPTSEGEWTFTDDLGVTVTLPSMPTKIVADVNAAAPLWDFGIAPIAVSGWTVDTPASWGNVDPNTPVINAVAGAPEPSIEALIELGAELFVTIAWAPDDIWSFTSTEAYQQTNQIVPVVAISVVGTADKNMQRFIDLATALGADLGSEEITAAKARFDASVESFKSVAAEKADITSMFGSFPVEGAEWYAAFSPDWSDLSWYRELGMNIVDPDVEVGEFWEFVSKEEAVKYPTDVFFQSARAGGMSLEQMQAEPLISQHPAVKAEQVGPWNQDFILSYQGLADALDAMIATLSVAEKVTE
ncbi:MAG: ABC transporter substrate-binding protein [Thermomicrobiales bacterium]|nr:ABC transporter substrate-binding protein [Thermomicrobiales bacterium]